MSTLQEWLMRGPIRCARRIGIIQDKDRYSSGTTIHQLPLFAFTNAICTMCELCEYVYFLLTRHIGGTFRNSIFVVSLREPRSQARWPL